jgi:hypothetical protein
MKRIERVKRILKHHALLLSIVFSAGFGIGYYIALLVQNQTKVFGIPAIIIAIFGGLGALFSLSKTIIDWFSAKKEKEKVPVLQFDSYVKAIESQIVGFADNITPQMTYFVRIKDTNPNTQGKIENAEGFLEIKGNSPRTSLKRIATVWSDNNQRSLSFSRQADLRLFTINETENIIFHSAKEKQGFTPNIKPYSNFISKELIIEIDCQRGVMKEKTLTVNFAEIINTAMMEEE